MFSSNNPYLTNINRKWGDYTLNSYLFGEFVSAKNVGMTTYLAALRELICTLGFGVRYIGYEFLVKAVAYYSMGSYQSKAVAIGKIAELYEIDTEFVSDNINSLLDINSDFTKSAKKLLKKDIAIQDGKDLDTVVAVIGAIFKTYYNYNVIGGNIADDVTKSTNYFKVIRNGKSCRK